MGMRFCTTCQRYQSSEGGYKEPRSCRGWRCQRCHEKKTLPIYATPKTIERLKRERGLA